MTKSCGNMTGGLTRIAALNNTNRHHVCVGDLKTANNATSYIRNSTEPGCSHIFFSVGITYSHVCSSMESCWIGSPNGFASSDESIRPSSSTINDNYVDGISLTYGSSFNRSHIWTFIADLRCPHSVPGYVGVNYLCLPELNTKDCSSDSSLHSPTFSRYLWQPTSEDIEMRLCQDQGHPDEGIYINNLELLCVVKLVLNKLVLNHKTMNSRYLSLA